MASRKFASAGAAVAGLAAPKGVKTTSEPASCFGSSGVHCTSRFSVAPAGGACSGAMGIEIPWLLVRCCRRQSAGVASLRCAGSVICSVAVTT